MIYCFVTVSYSCLLESFALFLIVQHRSFWIETTSLKTYLDCLEMLSIE